MERFLRIERLIGEEMMNRLAGSFVTVVGLGAVGSYAVEALARSGIGRFRLVDFDVVGVSNINRQLLALESTLGQPKVEVARQRILDINPLAEVDVLRTFVHEESIHQVLSPAPDLLIDAIDSVSPKVVLLSNAVSRGIRVVSSMGAALKRDPSKIRSGDIKDTGYCTLARHVRKRLKRAGISEGILCVYSEEMPSFRFSDPAANPPSEGEFLRGRRRRVLGSLPTITGIFGLTAANLALEVLLT